MVPRRMKNPVLYPGTDDPFLMSRSEVGTKLRVYAANSLEKIKDQSDVLVIGDRMTFRTPYPFVSGLQAAIRQKPGRDALRVAREFAVTDEAKTAIIRSREFYADLIDDATHDGYIYTREAADMLNVDPLTPYKWRTQGKIPQEAFVKEGHEVYIAAEALTSFVTWQLPEPLRDPSQQGFLQP